MGLRVGLAMKEYLQTQREGSLDYRVPHAQGSKSVCSLGIAALETVIGDSVTMT